MDNRLTTIALYHGRDVQLAKLAEECAELAAAVLKLRIQPYDIKTFKNVAEEMADVRIMLDQVEYLLASKAATDRYREKKIVRELGRIEREVKWP